MNELMNTVTINNTDLVVKEWNDHRVVTFSEIDTVHNRPRGTAKRRFNDNRRRFVPDRDYYVITKKDIENSTDIELGEKRTFESMIKSPRGLTFITESGYLMLVKSMNDDLAWDVQRKLVDNYFNMRSMNVQEELIDDTHNEYIAKLEQERDFYKNELAKRDNCITYLLGAIDNMKQFAGLSLSVEDYSKNDGGMNIPSWEEWSRKINTKINLLTRRTGFDTNKILHLVYRHLDAQYGCYTHDCSQMYYKTFDCMESMFKMMYWYETKYNTSMYGTLENELDHFEEIFGDEAA